MDQPSQGWAAARAPLAQHDVLVQVLQSPSALDCLIGTLSVFDGVVISIKNSSWRSADAPTLIESCQSVVYLTTSDAYISVVVWYQLSILDGRASDEERWRTGEQG